MRRSDIRIAILTLSGFIAIVFFGWVVGPRTPVEVDQVGYRGVAMEQLAFADDKAELMAANVAPDPVYDRDTEDTTKASEIYENVQVLGDLSDANFTRLMAQITEWVSPEQGCAYCHNDDGNFASDDNYAKIVSRRMIQMTQHINSQWQDHVGAVGVTCYTCHRGNPVPENIWFTDLSTTRTGPALGWRDGQNAPGIGSMSLPTDPLTRFLLEDHPIRVQTNRALPDGVNTQTIKSTEWTYSLMNHMSESLGVNCTFCHNSRDFAVWAESPPQRAVAWHGIRLSRDLNRQFLEPLQPVYPAHRLGAEGDAPKASCATCHNGLNKPLMGVSMLETFPELQAPGAN